MEEEKFLDLLDRGIKILDDEISKIDKVLPGEVAFKLYDTYGFPLDLTADILKGKGIKVDNVGFEKEMEIVGVGYRGTLQGKKLTLNLGLSHPVEIEVPDYITIKMDGNTKFTISSPDKQKLGAFAAMVRSKRPPEPFKGKGIRYSNEFILRKEGKKK